MRMDRMNANTFRTGMILAFVAMTSVPGSLGAQPASPLSVASAAPESGNFPTPIWPISPSRPKWSPA